MKDYNATCVLKAISTDNLWQSIGVYSMQSDVRFAVE